MRFANTQSQELENEHYVIVDCGDGLEPVYVPVGAAALIRHLAAAGDAVRRFGDALASLQVAIRAFGAAAGS